MPELPEVEWLVRNLAPKLMDQTVREMRVNRPRVLTPTSVPELTKALVGARFVEVFRRGKYMLFRLQSSEPVIVLGHLGMTGRMFVVPHGTPPPKHASLVLGLGSTDLIFEDPRYFGRFTLDCSAIENLGPEPLGPDFTVEYFAKALKRSSQPIKVKLLDQGLVAGVGNIYASEALYRAGIAPQLASKRLTAEQVANLWAAIREVLADAIDWGSTFRLHFPALFGDPTRKVEESREAVVERLRVYDRAGKPCLRCGAPIKRLVQAGRSTYHCPGCQRKRG